MSNDHKIYLSKRTLVIFVIPIILNILYASLFLHSFVPQVAIGLLSFFICFTFLYRPYKKINHDINAYNHGYNQDDIFKSNIFFSRSSEKFLNKTNGDLRTENAIRNSNKHAQYLALQNQINPHFLYNTLEGIRSDALVLGVSNIADIIESLGVYFRYTISKIDRFVTIDEEMSNLKNYLVIQNYRFGDKIKLVEIFDGCDISIRQCLIPKLILQPFFENSIIHGLETKVDKGTIKIFFSLTKDLLLITIEDDGIGIPEDKLLEINTDLDRVSMDDSDEKEKGGIAIKNVNNRIKLLLGEKYGIKFRSVLGFGTSVDLTVPIKFKG